MKKIILLFTVLILASCSKEESPEEVNMFTYSNTIEFTVLNEAGEDLLDKSNPGHYDHSSINLYYLKDGEKVKLFTSNLDYPKNFFIYNNRGQNRIRIFPYFEEGKEISHTIIEWAANNFDTLKTYHESKPNAVILREVWLNGESIWKGSSAEEPFYEIQN